MSESLVSVITPSYNCVETISQTIRSVQAQTYANWEMLIADDCSSDDTRTVVSAFAKDDPRIKLIACPWNGGAAATRNRAIQEARGRYIAFLDADDIWYPEKLSRQIAFMQSSGAKLSYTGYRRVSESGRQLGFIRPPSDLSYTELLKSSRIGCLTAIYDSAALGKVYLPNLQKHEDFALWLKILKRIDSAKGIPDVLADYRVASNSLSSNKFSAAKQQWKIYRKVEHISFAKAAGYFVNYAVHGVLNRLG